MNILLSICDLNLICSPFSDQRLNRTEKSAHSVQVLVYEGQRRAFSMAAAAVVQPLKESGHFCTHFLSMYIVNALSY